MDGLKPLEYSIVIPVKRGRKTLEDLTSKLVDEFTVRRVSFEIIFIDDHSTDGSWDLIVSLSKQYPEISGIRFSRTFGQHNATLCGMRNARGVFVITMDEDFQHPLNQIDTLITRQAITDADVVYGIPSKVQHPAWRNKLGAMAMAVIYWLMASKIKASSFRMMRRTIVIALDDVDRPDVIIDFHIGWVTTNIVNESVFHMSSQRGTSSYTVFALIRQFSKIVFGYVLIHKSKRLSGRKPGIQYTISKSTKKGAGYNLAV